MRNSFQILNYFLNLNVKNQVIVLLYRYQINKHQSFNQSILKNSISYIKATPRIDRRLVGFKQ